MFNVCFDYGHQPAADGQSAPQLNDFLPSYVDEAFPVYEGLFNEVISSALARYNSPKQPDQEPEESKASDSAAIMPPTDTQKRVELPACLEESLLQAMTQVKRT